MAIDGVVAQIGLAALEPFDKWRIAVVTNFLRRFVPFNLLGLFCPERITVLNRTLVKI